jgi:hypothetical protein
MGWKTSHILGARKDFRRRVVGRRGRIRVRRIDLPRPQPLGESRAGSAPEPLVPPTRPPRPAAGPERNGPPAPMIKLFARFPRLSYVPARLLGLGPEHAPAYARRPMEPVQR